MTEDALDMIDEEIDDAERNIAERQQLAQRCSQAEELEITNDAFYQYDFFSLHFPARCSTDAAARTDSNLGSLVCPVHHVDLCPLVQMPKIELCCSGLVVESAKLPFVCSSGFVVGNVTFMVVGAIFEADTWSCGAKQSRTMEVFFITTSRTSGLNGKPLPSICRCKTSILSLEWRKVCWRLHRRITSHAC